MQLNATGCGTGRLNATDCGTLADRKMRTVPTENPFCYLVKLFAGRLDRFVVHKLSPDHGKRTVNRTGKVFLAQPIRVSAVKMHNRGAFSGQNTFLKLHVYSPEFGSS